MGAYINMEGRVYGRLTVLRRAPVNPRGGSKARFYVRCACPKRTEKIVCGGHLRRGRVTSCGCVRQEMAGNLTKGRAAYTREVDPTRVALKSVFLHSYKTHALNKGRAFELTLDQFHALTQLDCHYCGTPPSTTSRPYFRNKQVGSEWKQRVTYTFNGLDREDSSGGYTQQNVVPCCISCNRAKNAMTLPQFRAWVDRLARHNGYTK